jgi:hypothetical protein
MVCVCVCVFGLMDAVCWSPGLRACVWFQDARINVHMCLLNCEGAALVAGGSLHNYTAGSLVAFEDRLDHESARNDHLPRQALDTHAKLVILGLSEPMLRMLCSTVLCSALCRTTAPHPKMHAVINTDPDNDRISLTVGAETRLLCAILYENP